MVYHPMTMIDARPRVDHWRNLKNSQAAFASFAKNDREPAPCEKERPTPPSNRGPPRA
jgi:hypothetical protein